MKNSYFILITVALVAAGAGLLIKSQSNTQQAQNAEIVPTAYVYQDNSDGSQTQKQGTFTFDKLSPTSGQSALSQRLNDLDSSFAKYGQNITPDQLPKDCTFTQGFWKTHSSAWPVSSLNLGKKSYTKSELLSIFNLAVTGNGLLSMSHQLIAAKLNVSNDTSTDAINSSISDADALIGDLIVPPVGNGYLSTEVTSSLTNDLDSFNNGLSGPAHCQ